MITFAMIKPDGLIASDDILNLIKQSGFKIIDSIKYKMSEHEAAIFYSIHSDKPFFNNLIKHMSSDVTIGLILSNDSVDTVDDFRSIVGSTSPIEAQYGTIRNLWGNKEGVTYKNTIHASDSNASADLESTIYFSFARS